MGDLWWRILKHCGGVESSNEFEVAQMFENSSFSTYVMKRKVIIRFCFTLLTISTIRFKSLSSYVKCLARWRWLDYFRGVFVGFDPQSSCVHCSWHFMWREVRHFIESQFLNLESRKTQKWNNNLVNYLILVTPLQVFSCIDIQFLSMSNFCSAASSYII